MQKIYKKDEHYSKVEIMDSGKVVRYVGYKDIDIALSKEYFQDIYKSIQDLEEDGYEEVKERRADHTDHVAGDLVMDLNGKYSRILSRSGTGELTLYKLSYWSKNLNSKDLKGFGGSFTAYELVKMGYTNPQQEDTKAKECLEYLEKVGKVKDGKVVEV